MVITTNRRQIVTQVHLVWDLRRATLDIHLCDSGDLLLGIIWSCPSETWPTLLAWGEPSGAWSSLPKRQHISLFVHLVICKPPMNSILITEKSLWHLTELLQGTESSGRRPYASPPRDPSPKPSEAGQLLGKSESGQAWAAPFLGAQVLKISSFPWSWRKQQQDSPHHLLIILSDSASPIYLFQPRGSCPGLKDKNKN